MKAGDQSDLDGTVWASLPGGRATEAVADAIAKDLSPHAWLLAGPRGSGKMSVALAMAAALNCDRLQGVGCGRCSRCRRIARRSYLDVHHIAPEGPLISVEVIRTNVIPEAARSPFEGDRKVFVIDEAERMNPQAQNALLKTLEEPPADTVFILLCDQEDEILETIRSRCRTLRLGAVAQADVISWLETRGATPEQAATAAGLADGNLDRAAAFAFDANAANRRRIFSGLPSRLLSVVAALEAATEVMSEASLASRERAREQRDEIEELAEALGDGRGTASIRTALARRHKRELRRVEEDVLIESLESLGSFYRDVLAVRSRARGAVANTDMIGEIDVWAVSDVAAAGLAEAMHRCADAPNALAKNANPALTVEATLVMLARLVPPPLQDAPACNA